MKAPILLKLAITTTTLPLFLSAAARADDASGRWPVAKAWYWYAEQPWLVGCNFLPSTAVNDVEMWQAETFDAHSIDRELGWAQGLGFNTVRVFINYVVWKGDPAGLKRRLDQFLAIADRHGIKTLIILLDDCFKQNPHVGKQDDPIPGVHNSQWVASPGKRMVQDAGRWGDLEQYVSGMIGRFAGDRRVLAWELYNEPTQSLPLVEAAFRWARRTRPSQPVTATLFGPAEMQRRILDLSDVVSFHQYGQLPALKATVAKLQEQGRPLLCTEWMARKNGSRFETHLPFFKQQKIGCWSWGFVAGRTQTFFPWGSKPGTAEPALWFHDILRGNGTPYDDRETATIRLLTGRGSATPSPRP
jgi:hypothetical protein